MLQEAQMKRGPANASVRTEPKIANAITESKNVAVKTGLEAGNAITEPVNISLRATEPENS